MASSSIKDEDVTLRHDENSSDTENEHSDQQKLDQDVQLCRPPPYLPVVGADPGCGDAAESAEIMLMGETESPQPVDASACDQPIVSDPSPCHGVSPPESVAALEPVRVALPEEPAAAAEPARSAEPESAAAGAGQHVSDMAHHIKWVQFHGARSPVITQNVNGPCPLLALINVMLLKGKVQLPSALEVITIGQLMDYIGDTMLDSAPAEAQQPDFQQNMQDAVAILPKLQTGLDVNVKFSG